MTGRSLAADVRRARRSLARFLPARVLDAASRAHHEGAHELHRLPRECHLCLAAQRRRIRETQR